MITNQPGQMGVEKASQSTNVRPLLKEQYASRNPKKPSKRFAKLKEYLKPKGK